MNNLLDSLKRFLKNKNTVTIIGVIFILVLLYIGYSTQINRAVEPVNVPVAAQNIQPRTLITADMVNNVDMPSISISENVITSSGAIIGKYSNVNTLIPAGSMFYRETVIDAKELPDAALVELKSGEIAYNFPIDMDSTYGNSIMPGNRIDIYMKYGDGTDENVTLGKLLNNIKVLAVKDSSGKAVFEDSESERTPAMMIFGLKEKNWLLLRKAYYLGDLGVELFPVPHSGTVDTDGATEVSTKQLEDYINAHATDIPVNTNEEVQAAADTLMPTAVETGGNPNTVTITYPDGCGSKYVCKYKKNNDAEKTVTKTTQNVRYTGNGTLVATVTETDGTAHTLNLNIPMTNTNSTENRG